jgi:hypothetical protein
MLIGGPATMKQPQAVDAANAISVTPHPTPASTLGRWSQMQFDKVQDPDPKKAASTKVPNLVAGGVGRVRGFENCGFFVKSSGRTAPTTS